MLAGAGDDDDVDIDEDDDEPDEYVGGAGEIEANSSPTAATTTATTTNRGGNNNRKAASTGNKRLTTAEEVSLFEICNRHADTFGHRSKLCEWWITVANEFTQKQGFPYSWHSVRRKVEIMSKQRLKFLRARGQNNSNDGNDDNTAEAAAGGDPSYPQWRAVVDAWIPNWQRWEDAEARRIRKRDSRNSRKRKEPTDLWEATGGGGRLATPTTEGPSGGPSLSPLNGTRQNSSATCLPAGFESMFQNYNNGSPAQAYSTGSSTTAAVVSALLETLGRLNQQEVPSSSSSSVEQLRNEVQELRRNMEGEQARLEEKLDSMEKTQRDILSILKPDSF